MNWIFYGLIFVGVGVVQMYRKARERKHGHTHRCPKCGTTWAHKSVDTYPTARAGVDAHTCPKCGTEQFEIDSIGAEKTPLTVAGAAQGATGGSGADGTALQQRPSDLGRERPIASPKDRDTADHAVGPAHGGEVGQPQGPHKPPALGSTPGPATMEKKPA